MDLGFSNPIANIDIFKIQIMLISEILSLLLGYMQSQSRIQSKREV